MKLMIMLPLHGQNTAAVKQKVTGQKTLSINSKSYVFDKQSSSKFAEFLLIFLKNKTNFNISQNKTKINKQILMSTLSLKVFLKTKRKYVIKRKQNISYNTFFNKSNF